MRSRLASALLVAGYVLSMSAGASEKASQSQPGGAPFVGGVVEEPSPAPSASAQPHLSVDRRGLVRLSWLAALENGGHRFQMSEYRGSRWTPPVTIAEGGGFVANWADVPSTFVTTGDVIAAHWLQRGEGRGSYGIRVSTSSDGGQTWSAAVTPHRDGTASEHGFVSFFEAPQSTLGLVWLDGRLVAERGRAGSMSLRATMFNGDALGEEQLIDPRVCDCCPTSAARVDGGVIVAYRDRSEDEIRDISVARFTHGKWTAPVTVFEDKWQINACPVNGPAIAAVGRSVGIAWFTVAGGAGKVKVAFSGDGGQTFSAPAVVESEATFGRLGIIMPEDDRVIVSSIEKVSGSDFIVVREARRNGRVGPPTMIAPTTFERTSGFPRMVASGRRVWFAWTDVISGPTPRVRLASARLK